MFVVRLAHRARGETVLDRLLVRDRLDVGSRNHPALFAVVVRQSVDDPHFPLRSGVRAMCSGTARFGLRVVHGRRTFVVRPAHRARRETVLDRLLMRNRLEVRTRDHPALRAVVVRRPVDHPHVTTTIARWCVVLAGRGVVGRACRTGGEAVLDGLGVRDLLGLRVAQPFAGLQVVVRLAVHDPDVGRRIGLGACGFAWGFAGRARREAVFDGLAERDVLGTVGGKSFARAAVVVGLPVDNPHVAAVGVVGLLPVVAPGRPVLGRGPDTGGPAPRGDRIGIADHTGLEAVLDGLCVRDGFGVEAVQFFAVLDVVLREAVGDPYLRRLAFGRTARTARTARAACAVCAVCGAAVPGTACGSAAVGHGGGRMVEGPRPGAGCRGRAGCCGGADQGRFARCIVLGVLFGVVRPAVGARRKAVLDGLRVRDSLGLAAGQLPAVCAVVVRSPVDDQYLACGRAVDAGLLRTRRLGDRLAGAARHEAVLHGLDQWDPFCVAGVEFGAVGPVVTRFAVDDQRVGAIVETVVAVGTTVARRSLRPRGLRRRGRGGRVLPVVGLTLLGRARAFVAVLGLLTAPLLTNEQHQRDRGERARGQRDDQPHRARQRETQHQADDGDDQQPDQDHRVSPPGVNSGTPTDACR